MRNTKNKDSTSFYKEINEIKLDKNTENDNLLFYSLRLIKNDNLNLLNLTQINELICVAESSKANNSQPRIGYFLSALAIVIAFLTSSMRDLDVINDPTFGIIYCTILGGIFFIMILEGKRIKKHSDIIYYLEKLKQAKEDLK